MIRPASVHCYGMSWRESERESPSSTPQLIGICRTPASDWRRPAGRKLRVRELGPSCRGRTVLEQERDAAYGRIERGEELPYVSKQPARSAAPSREYQRCEQLITTLELSAGRCPSRPATRTPGYAPGPACPPERAQEAPQKISLEQRDESAAHKTAAGNEARLEENVSKILAKQSVAEELPALEESCRGLEDQLRKIETRREQHRRSSEASEGGNCPS